MTNSPRDKRKLNHKGSINVNKCGTGGVECRCSKKHHLLDVYLEFLKINVATQWDETRQLRLLFLCPKSNH